MSSAYTARRSTPVIDLLLAVYLYVFMEWLFLATKPSFFVTMPWLERAGVGLAAVLVPGAAALLAYALLTLLARALPGRFGIGTWLQVLPQALVLAALSLLLVDNFSLTVLGLGVRDTRGIGALIYLALWLAAFGLLWWRLGKKRRARAEAFDPGRALAPALLLASIGAAAALYLGVQSAAPKIELARAELPDILFFASDGIDANYLSAYGYERPTSPNLDRLTPESRVFQAAVSNAARTTGSTTAMLTGKYPTTTKVLFPPHTLRGADAFEHLPGILRRLGYRSFQASIRYYADGPDLNMREAFDYANRREVRSSSPGWVSPRATVAFADTSLFLQRMGSRIVDRLLHLSLQQPMQDVFGAVSDDPAKVYGFRDRTRVNQLRNFVRKNNGPLFLHVHLMNSHCCKFRPEKTVFSKGLTEQNRENRDLFFADAVLESDAYFGEVLGELEAQGRLENTLIVYSSDHGIQWRANQRMPLIMRFPGGEHAGEVHTTVQLLDVAPTILDYLNVPVPDWMEGVSLIGDPPEKHRPLFSIGGVNREMIRTKRDTVSRLVGSGPPNYGMKSMLMTVCDRWYSLALDSGKLGLGRIKGHPSPCPAEELPGRKGARRLLDRHLAERGFTPPGRPKGQR